MFTMQTFTTWLISEIEARGWNRSELARRANLSPTAVSDVLSGRRNPGMDLCNGIALALKLPPEEVYRVAGLLPEEQASDPTLYRIQNLYHTLREDDHKQKALEFLQFLSDLDE